MESNHDPKVYELTANGSIITPFSERTFDNNEPFETFQNRVVALAPELRVEFQDIERVTGGTEHRILGLTVRNPPIESGFSDSTEAILRVARLDPYEPVEGEPEWNEDVAAELAAWVAPEELDEAAVLSLLARSGIKVPTVLACDTTRKNALNYPYLLQTRLPGTTLWKVWDDMSVDDRINIAGELAEILAKMDSVRFPVAGRLLYDETSKTAKQSLDLAHISEIGEKLVVRGFHRFFEEHHQRDAPTAPPTSSLYELLSMYIDARFQHKRADGHEIPGPELLKLQAMLQDMKDMGWFASDDGNATYSIIDHAQLSPFGIMVEQSKNAEGNLGWHISGVLQWEHARSIPPVLARRPPAWLFEVPDEDSKPLHKRKFHRRSSLPQAVRRYQDGDSDMIPLEYYQEMNSDPITAKIKERFEEVMVEKIYSPRYGAKAMEVYQDDAYGKGRWLRRVWRLAKDAHSSKGRLQQVLKEWDEFKQTGQVSHETVFGDEDDSDLNDSNSTTSNDSKSTTSTDAYDHEPFESFEHKIETLLHDLNIGHFGIDRMRGGSFNRVVPVTFRVESETESWVPFTKAILRIPRVWDGDLAKLPAYKHGRTCKCDAHPERKTDDVEEDAESENDALVTDETTKEPASDENNPSAEQDDVSDSSDISDDDSDVSDISSRRSLSKEPFRWEILDEAVLYNLLEDAGIPAPRILAFDVGRRNALKFPYSIQTRLPGVSWISVIEKMPFENQLVLAEELAGTTARLHTVQFESSGRLQCDQKLDTPLQLSLTSSSREIKENLKIWGFPKETGELGDSERTSPCQPVWSSLYELLSHAVQDLLARELQKSYPFGPSERLVRMYFKLEDMLQDMDHIGWFSEADKAPSKSVLHHWDLEARNIMVKQKDRNSPWHISGVIDWDSPHALPPVLTMKPPIWLWDASDDAELPADVQKYYDNDFDWMPLEYHQKENAEHFNSDGIKVKQRFEETIVKALYSEQYGVDAHAKYADDAYGRGRWLRRIWRFASEGVYTNGHHHRMEQLDREWDAYKKANGIEYDPAERAKQMRVYSPERMPEYVYKDGPSQSTGNTQAALAVPGNSVDADTTMPEGEELQTVNLGQTATEAPEQKLPRSKTFSTFLHSFKCSPS
jgi:hypothetical protein